MSADLLQHRVLTAAEERELLERYAALRAEHGPSDKRTLRVRNELVTANTKLVARVAKGIPGLPLEDRIGEGVLGLIVAIERFDVSRKLRLSTFAVPWIRHHVQRATQDTERTVRLPVSRLAHLGRALRAGTDGRDGVALELAGLSLDAPVGDRGEGGMSPPHTLYDFVPDERAVPAEELLAMKEDAELAAELLGELEPQECAVVVARYGLADGREMTLEQISKGMKCSREHVRQLELGAIEAMRGLVA